MPAAALPPPVLLPQQREASREPRRAPSGAIHHPSQPPPPASFCFLRVLQMAATGVGAGCLAPASAYALIRRRRPGRPPASSARGSGASRVAATSSTSAGRAPRRAPRSSSSSWPRPSCPASSRRPCPRLPSRRPRRSRDGLQEGAGLGAVPAVAGEPAGGEGPARPREAQPPADPHPGGGHVWAARGVPQVQSRHRRRGNQSQGIVFARGPAVAVLILLESKGQTYAVLTEQHSAATSSSPLFAGARLSMLPPINVDKPPSKRLSEEKLLVSNASKLLAWTRQK
ncbi:translation initiation factor IF-2 isoform X2 [Triticum aestivum]|uniref:translation initiation factor IF-2 isoform X2 n=1 Tax=Triticum aestivum TaxID=4565 RepID=UPI001D02D888|nr:translation initiation factor IF-2-like isoform X2 [Triticum aestivum]